MDKKKKILNFLEKQGSSATNKIAMAIKSNQWMAEKYLEQLESERKVKKTVVPNAIYWDII